MEKLLKVAFIANYNKTYYFHAIAEELKRLNVSVHWIVINKKNFNYLKEYYAPGELLYLNNSIINEQNVYEIDDFKLNELVYGDRVLKHKYKFGYSLLTSIQSPIYNFLKENNIKVVFGELTWAHELLICRLIKKRRELDCKFLNPHTIRIPAGRFGFFKDEFQSVLYEIDDAFMDKAIPENAFVVKKPDYLQLNDLILKNSYSPKTRLKRIRNLITSKNIDSDDFTMFNNTDLKRFLLPIKHEVNKELYFRLNTISLIELEGKKFVLYTMHKQPEASIDVLGRYYEDQKQNIVNIWKQLPQGWLLVIKEHTNAIGDRSLSFYNELLKFENLFFISEKADSYKLIEKCEAVFTVSGTIAYEAALKGVKAFVFADVFFNLKYVRKITLEDFKYCSSLNDLIDSLPRDIDDSLVKKQIYHNSFEGIVSDPVSNPLCMSKDNISKVANAFFRVLQ